MSGIAGILNLDGRPADESLLRRMVDAIAHRGPDGSGLWIAGSVGLGHRMLRTTPESAAEKQPLTDESGTLSLTFDGRVDNRQEISSLLSSHGWKLRDQTDAEIILRAYQCWGEECAGKIVGDFAFVVWDGKKQQLFCVRDVVGLKPFYYYHDARRFLCASELHQILLASDVARKPNEGIIAEYLAGIPSSLRDTLYNNIFQLPRAHWLIVTPGQMRLQCYWTAGSSREIRYRNDADYAENFRSLFQQAVKCHLRSPQTVAAELSGGLDSSTVVSMAHWLQHHGGGDPVIETISLQFPGQPHDETDYIRAVVERWNVRANFFPEGEMETSLFLRGIQRYQDLPDAPSSAIFNRQLEFVQQRGLRVVLSGLGGDAWLTGSLRNTADLVRRWQFLRAFRQSESDSAYLASFGVTQSPSSVFYRHGLRPLAPRFLEQAAKALVGKNRTLVPAWINPQFARATRLIDRWVNTGAPADPSETIAGKDIRAGLNFPFYWLIDRYYSQFGIEYRSPFLNRRLIEYCLSLPHDQLRRGVHAKFVLRQAMSGIVPELVRMRVTKARFTTHSFRNAIEAMGGERLYGSLMIASNGWISGDAVIRMYRETAAQSATRYLFPLWFIGAVELWFRNVFVNGDSGRHDN
jgi:asparagine synthase (glutamine-hydrolysing)